SERFAMSREAPHDVPFAVVVLLAACRIVFVVDGAGEHEATLRPENERRAVQDRPGRRSSHVAVEAELSGNGDDTGLHAARVWQELRAQMRARAVGTDQHVAGRARSVLKAGRDGASWVVLEGNALLAVLNDPAEPLAENGAQRHAAHR